MMLVIHMHDGHNPERESNRGPGEMGHSQADKARSRERILNEAATQIRDKGLEALSIGGLMQQVKLTHGGFYGHFASRSDLIAAALEQALNAGEASAHAARGPDKPVNINALARSYLSRAHRDFAQVGLRDRRADLRCRPRRCAVPRRDGAPHRSLHRQGRRDVRRR
ncbi:TetR/AcrR family transcriptional regulator [Bradyrhizobium sp. BR 1433]|uniref:TetR/AcrR family transcriptional regulator n=1 Tax=Bradyrhizobium sp. BR 1433 TaxID=3447967 RepID=UPI003EE479D2